MRLFKHRQKPDKGFILLLQRYISSSIDSERADILQQLKNYGEAFPMQILLLLKNGKYQRLSYNFFEQCNDEALIELLVINMRVQTRVASKRRASIILFQALNVLIVFYMGLILNKEGMLFFMYPVMVFSTYWRDKPFINSNQRLAISRFLLQTEDCRFMGAICILILPDKSLHYDKLWDRMMHLLPQISEEHKPFFNHPEQNAMLGLVERLPQEVSCCLLQALGKVGDSHLLQGLRRLSYKGVSLKTSRAAQQCIKEIQAREITGQEPATLLRASNATEQTDSLLRPAQHTNDDDTNQLLRPR